MNKLLTYFLFAIACNVTLAQNINGRIINLEGKGVANVHIRVQGTAKGFLSDNNGYFVLSEIDTDDILIFSHIEYESDTITIPKNDTPIQICLIPKTYHLKTINIYDKHVICLMPDTPLFITDYEIWEEQIVLTANKMRKSNQPKLIFMNMEGMIGATADIVNPEGLFKDPMNNIYYASNDKAWQIFKYGDTVYYSQPFDSKLYKEAENHWAESIGDSIIFTYHYYNNQGLGYYLKTPQIDTAKEWFSFVDENALDRMSWGGFFDNNEFDQRFAQQIVYKPVQVPMYFFQDSIVAFNFINQKIEFYRHDGTFIKSVDMQYSYNNKMEYEIYYDEVYKKFYGREIRSGRNSLIEININTGLPLETYTFKGYPHIENLQVYGNELFFIYKDYSGDEYRRLYKSPLVKQSARL